MKIASWNINSIKARKDHVIKWLKSTDVDILLLQELKSIEFPTEDFADIGYRSIFKGQKAYNGIAILSKETLPIIIASLPNYQQDEQARYLETKINNNTHLINIYLPNGNPTPGAKYEYKLEWMAKLYQHLKELRNNEIDIIIGGDFNIIPENKDCYNPAAWQDDALFQLETRWFYRKFINLGLTDAFRISNNSSEQYSFWDYQAGCWPKNNGIRIDHFLTSPKITDKINQCYIDKEPRSWERPSDHTPIIIEL